MVELLANGGKEMKHLMLKAGLAVALSVAGYIFSQIRSRQAAAARRRRLPSPSGEIEGHGGLKEEELHFMKKEGASPNLSGSTMTVPDADAGFSPMSKSLGDEDGYLLPAFNVLVHEEFKMTEKESDPQSFHALTPAIIENSENSEIEQELANLRNLVQSLQERERNLEFQLLEYYGLKEQDAAVKELESRIKISSVEAKLFALKIESLQAENRRLESQLSDHSRVKTELESTKEKIKILKRKLKSDTYQVEKMAALQERAAALEDNELAEWEHDENVERSLKRLRDLEAEAMDLRKENSNLAQANLELTKKLESNQAVGFTPIDTSEVTDALEEANRLRKKNKELSNELERLKTDRFTNVEELVYLRWVNACLRYELRNHQPPEGKTVARDLSKTLSPKSEEKAKQLILEYANLGHDEKILMDFDSEYCSSSQESSLTENEELDNTSTSTKNSGSSGKIKIFSKLKKLVLGRENHSKRFSPLDRTPTSYGNSGRRASVSNCSFDDVMGRYSFDSISSSVSMDHAPNNHLTIIDEMAAQNQNKTSWTRTSFDIQKSKMSSVEEARGAKADRCKSDLGSTFAYKRFVLGEQSYLDSPLSEQLSHETLDSPVKVELKKFAGILKSNRQSPRTHERSGSYNT